MRLQFAAILRKPSAVLLVIPRQTAQLEALLLKRRRFRLNAAG